MTPEHIKKLIADGEGLTNVDRYDDRLTVGTNLIEAYEQLIDFATRHTLDKFFLVDNQRISVRDWIARELVSNLLVHREYSKGFLARFIIEKDRIYAENWNRSNAHGRMDPDDFTPDAKNPLLAWFFVNIGRADYMGSGVRNLYRFTKIYSGGEPELIEGDIFKAIIPLKPENSSSWSMDGSMDGNMDGSMDGVTIHAERMAALLDYCLVPRSRDEMQLHLGITNRDYFRKSILKPLLDAGRLKMTIPDKPKSPNQKYVTR